MRKEEKCTHCLGSCEFALMHTNTHRPVTSAQSSDRRAEKKMTERKTPRLAVSLCVCLCLATQEKQKSRSGGG